MGLAPRARGRSREEMDVVVTDTTTLQEKKMDVVVTDTTLQEIK